MTSDSGLLLVRQLDERLGLSLLMAEHLTDDRRRKNKTGPAVVFFLAASMWKEES